MYIDTRSAKYCKNNKRQFWLCHTSLRYHLANFHGSTILSTFYLYSILIDIKHNQNLNFLEIINIIHTVENPVLYDGYLTGDYIYIDKNKRHCSDDQTLY